MVIVGVPDEDMLMGKSLDSLFLQFTCDVIKLKGVPNVPVPQPLLGLTLQKYSVSASKLLVLKVDTGIDVRTIVSGIAESFTAEEIIGK